MKGGGICHFHIILSLKPLKKSKCKVNKYSWSFFLSLKAEDEIPVWKMSSLYLQGSDFVIIMI